MSDTPSTHGRAEEILQLCDSQGNPTGTAPRSTCHGDPAKIHLVVHLHLFGPGGSSLFVQQRAWDKDLYPGRWDTAVGGHVAAGERIRMALMREAAEELGVDAGEARPLYQYLHRNEYESEYVHTFALDYDARRHGKIRVDPVEVADARFFSPEEITAGLGAGTFTPNFEEEFIRITAHPERLRDFLRAAGPPSGAPRGGSAAAGSVPPQRRAPGLTREQRSLFTTAMRGYYRLEGRRFPWRETRDPYAILVSEMMLQQTQTRRVQTKFPQFLARFPDIRSLANASTAQVIAAWQGLGYNRRALALHEAARRVVTEFDGKVPADPAVLAGFRGIGPATAAEIAAFAHGVAVPLVETNIRRLFIFLFFPPVFPPDSPDSPVAPVSDREILSLVEQTLDHHDPRTWYYALMDYGVMLKNRLAGRGMEDPNRRSAHYRRQPPFQGSDRQIRGAVLRVLARTGAVEERSLVTEVAGEIQAQPSSSHRVAEARPGAKSLRGADVAQGTDVPPGTKPPLRESELDLRRVGRIIEQLAREGFLIRDETGGGLIRLA